MITLSENIFIEITPINLPDKDISSVIKLKLEQFSKDLELLGYKCDIREQVMTK